MKLTLVLLISFFGINAFASVTNEITAVESLAFNGKVLDFTYRTGGGCSDHTAIVDVVIEPKTSTAIVKVYDSTPNGDDCEAYIAVSGSVDLKALALAKAKAAGLDEGGFLKLQLPIVNLDSSPF